MAFTFTAPNFSSATSALNKPLPNPAAPTVVVPTPTTVTRGRATFIWLNNWINRQINSYGSGLPNMLGGQIFNNRLQESTLAGLTETQRNLVNLTNANNTREIKTLLNTARTDLSTIFGTSMSNVPNAVIGALEDLMARNNTSKEAKSLISSWLEDSGVSHIDIIKDFTAAGLDSSRKNQAAAKIILDLGISSGQIKKAKAGDETAAETIISHFGNAPITGSFVQAALINDSTILAGLEALENSIIGGATSIPGLTGPQITQLKTKITNDRIDARNLKDTSIELSERLETRLGITDENFERIEIRDQATIDRVFGTGTYASGTNLFTFTFGEFLEDFVKGGADRDRAVGYFLEAYTILEDRKIQQLIANDTDSATETSNQQAIMIEILRDPEILDDTGKIQAEIKKHFDKPAVQTGVLQQTIVKVGEQALALSNHLIQDFSTQWNSTNPTETITTFNKQALEALSNSKKASIDNLATEIQTQIQTAYGVTTIPFAGIRQSLQKIANADQAALSPVDNLIKALITNDPASFNLIQSDSEGLQIYGLAKLEADIQSSTLGTAEKAQMQNRVRGFLGVSSKTAINTTSIENIETFSSTIPTGLYISSVDQTILNIGNLDPDQTNGTDEFSKNQKTGIRQTKAILDENINIGTPLFGASSELVLSTNTMTIEEALRSTDTEIKQQGLKAFIYYAQGKDKVNNIINSGLVNVGLGVTQVGYSNWNTETAAVNFNSTLSALESNGTISRFATLDTLAEQYLTISDTAQGIDNYTKQAVSQSSLANLAKLNSTIGTVLDAREAGQTVGPQVQNQFNSAVNAMETSATSYVQSHYNLTPNLMSFIRDIIKYFFDAELKGNR